MKTYILGTLLMFGLGTVAVADDMSEKEGSSRLKEEFSVLDKNQDGKLVPEEAGQLETLATSFNEADINGNGVIELGEYIVHQSEATAAGEPKKEQSNW